MTLVQSIILSLIQGISEFLPISSSGHLNLAQYFLHLTPSLSLDIFLNTATLCSVLFFFRKQISYFFKNLKFIIIGSIPAVLVGFFLKDQINSIFSDISFLPFSFLLTSVFVLLTKFITKKDREMTYKKAFLIGIFQSIAILPGVSRSGATIFAALFLGLSITEAFNFSFCLFIPASLGALFLDIKNISSITLFSSEYILAFLVTFFVGILALSLLRRILQHHHFWIFSIYTLILAVSLFFLL